MAKTTRESFKFMLRMPDELRDALREATLKSNRTMTSEIISRLEESFRVAKSLEGAPERLSEISGSDRAALISKILDQNRQLLAALEFDVISADALTEKD